MQKILLVSVLVSLVLIGIIWSYVGDMVGGDMVNMLSMLAAVLILVITVGVGAKYVNQMKTDEATGELAEDNWDGIGEYKNELPTGWALSFLGTIVFALWYWFSGYPLWAYSQIGEWNDESKAHNSKFEEIYKDADSETLVRMGESVFLVQCAPCHGTNAEGLNGKAQNLVTWGKEDHIIKTILNGSGNMNTFTGYMNFPLGAMPATDVTSEQAKAIASYVVEKLTPASTKYPELVSEGEALYAGAGGCIGCHGDDGKGMAGQAPDLTNLASAALTHGRKGNIGIMPNFNDGRLTDTQFKALNTYIYSLAN
jgi:cytochrome c oxidase cbb3-type subunit 3